MPLDLKEHINSLPAKERKQIWISCRGENPADTEAVGPIQYIPSRGFPSFFYPFKNTVDYLSPLVAIRFERPRSKKSLHFCRKKYMRSLFDYFILFIFSQSNHQR